MTPEQPPLPSRPWLDLLWGILASDAITGGVFVVAGLLAARASDSSLMPYVAIPSLFLLPLMNGLLAAFFWRRLHPSVGEVALQVLLLISLNLAAAAIFLREGVICLIIVSPLLYVLTLAGACMGRMLFKTDHSRLGLSLVPALALLIAGEPFVRTVREGVVTDEILIHAPPARVWPLVTAFPPIPEPPKYWLFRIGLPYPVSTETDGNFRGAGRRCIFNKGLTFTEKVAEFLPERELTFDIVDIPRDPELLGHLTPERGQFLLRDNGDGTTTLTGSTWYVLHVRPLWYFDWWTHQIFQAVHLRVMEDVRRRAESPQPAG